MKVLFIGGTGNISMACVHRAIQKGFDVYVLNRGKNSRPVPPEVKVITADINRPAEVAQAIGSLRFDVVTNFIAFTPQEVQRDIDLFAGKIGQYIFISSASAYQKPPTHPIITESTPLYNPYWQYSRDKIACEEHLNRAYQEQHFPMTIVRPSHTYQTVIPAAIGSWEDFTLIDRIRRGQPIIVHGDGTSLWTMTHSEDFAIGFVGLLANQQSIGHAFHITSDEVLTWNQIYDAMAEAAGREAIKVYIPSTVVAKFAPEVGANLLGDKANSSVFDNTKIKRLVPEFVATIPFRRGIKRTVDWFDADPSRIRILPETNQIMDRMINAFQALHP